MNKTRNKQTRGEYLPQRKVPRDPSKQTNKQKLNNRPLGGEVAGEPVGGPAWPQNLQHAPWREPGCQVRFLRPRVCEQSSAAPPARCPARVLTPLEPVPSRCPARGRTPAGLGRDVRSPFVASQGPVRELGRRLERAPQGAAEEAWEEL